MTTDYSPSLAEGLFVYGTLKTGEANHRVVERFVVSCHQAVLAGRLYDFGPYPGLSLDGEAMAVHGQFMVLRDAVRAFVGLDMLEDFHPSRPERSLYVRSVVDVAVGWDTRTAWVYHMPDAVAASRGTLVASGRWAPALRR